ncbi:MAG: hypothetical protein KF819_40465 [Labilithrix sp.]|nr:hypothetical protein [Labilithrix sp.]
MSQYPPPQWSQPPPGYPPPGYPPPGQAPPGAPFGPPPEKKKFRFQMWMLGAIIVPIGIGIAIRDVLKRGTIDLGGECSDSEHCKSHTCLTGEISVCTKSCSPFDPCPSGFSCDAVNVTLNNQAGSHNLGTQHYCMPSHGGASAAASEPSATEPTASAPVASAAPSATTEPDPEPPPAAAPAAAKPAPVKKKAKTKKK